MSKQDKNKKTAPDADVLQETPPEVESAAADTPAGEAPGEPTPDSKALTDALEQTEKAMAALKDKEDQFLRLAAEYDNYRKRTAREKEAAWTEAKAQTVAAFLPVYENLERALKQACADEANLQPRPWRTG